MTVHLILLTVVRQVERNPLRAGLVARAEDWRWSSLAPPPPAGAPKRHCPLPSDRRAVVGRAEAAARLEAVRHSVNHGTPFGSDRWVPRTARRLGLESTLRPRGRPRKPPKK